MILGMAAPVFMMGLNANVNIECDDFYSLEYIEQLRPFMMSLDGLTEIICGKDRNAVLEAKGNPAEYPLSEEDSLDQKHTKIFFEFFHELVILLESEDNEVSAMEIKLHVPELAIVNFKVESEGLGKALATGIMLTIYRSILNDLKK